MNGPILIEVLVPRGMEVQVLFAASHSKIKN
jgi:hypothetical protein